MTFGFWPTTGVLGGRVFIDANGDNTENNGSGGFDAGRAGVTVQLLNLWGHVVATTTTDAHGNYSFTAAGGHYSVRFTAPANTQFVAKDVGHDNADSDVNPSNGTTGLVSIINGKTVWDVDAGLKSTPGVVTGRFFRDDNGDNTEFNGRGGFDAGVAGQRVELLNAQGHVVASTHTNHDGIYTFNGVAPGDYSVRFTPPAGFAFVTQDVGDIRADSDADANGRTANFRVEAGQTASEVDAGVRPNPGSIEGRYFFDLDRNNLESGGDTGVSGVKVELFNPHGLFIATTTTDANGNYRFQNVAPGDYFVKFQSVANTKFSKPNVGGDDRIDSDVIGSDPHWGWTERFTVAAGQNKTDVDAGATREVGAVTGRVFIDSNGDNTERNGAALEAGFAGVTVQLLNAAGHVVATTTTDAAGIYRIEAAPGDYRIKVLAPAGQQFVANNVGDDPNVVGDDGDRFDSDVVQSTGITDQVVNIRVGATVFEVDAGLRAALSVDARDDALTVTESEATGDTDINVLTNDVFTGTGATAPRVTAVNGVAGAVGQFVDVAGGGKIRINADGTVDFSADGDFEDLNNGQSRTVTAQYTISTSVPGAVDGKLNFDFFNRAPEHFTINNIPTTPGQFRGTATNFDVNKLALDLTHDSDTYSIRYTGNILIKQGGSYSFTIGGDDGVGIFINGVRVAVRDGLHPFESATGSINLGAGAHTIEIRFFENTGFEGLAVSYTGADTGNVSSSIFGAVSSQPIVTQTVTDTATVSITVTGENDNAAPVITTGNLSTAENQVAIATLAASDANGDAVTWTISGADSALFNIDPATGALSWKVAPDFETPLDAVNGDNIYDVTATANDGNGGVTSKDLFITVTNVNEAPVIISGAAASVAENATAVTTVTAVDPDAGAVISFALSGPDAALFTIDANGQLSFIAAPNFEAPGDAGGDNVYNVSVTASDGLGGTTTQDLAVTVTDVNEVPVISAVNVQVAENSTFVSQPVANDPDAGAALVWSISGTDAALFTIDPATGELRFAAAPNFEAPADAGGNNVYDVIIQVSDGQGGVAQTAIAVTVTNVNELPVITSATTVSVAENGTAVATQTAVDPDGDPVTWQIGGVDGGRFNIDPVTGVLTFKVAPNFEAPQDAGGNNVYDVTVFANDGRGGLVSHSVAVTVTDVAENVAPTITTADLSSAENQTTVATLAAIDPNGDAVTWSISGPDAALFAVNAITGALSFIAAPNFEAPGDAGGNNVYDIIVTANDGNGGVTSKPIAVTVTNVNEAPTITSAPAASVAENSTAVATITAVDPDAGAVVTFALSGPDAALFAIDPATGVLTFIAPPNFEAPQDAGGDNVYDVTVTASDGLGGTTTQDLAVTVTNVNEAPTITSAPAASVAENSTAVATITAVDPDAGAVISFALSGPDAALFAIDPATGVLTFIAPPNFDAPQDAGGNNVYDVTVTASDGLGGTTTQNLAVTVTNVNEAPTITSAPAASVAENSTAVATITAVDPDAGAVISFALSGPDAALFAIDPATGVLTFIAPPNFDAPQDAGGNNVYDVTVTASDGLGGTTTQNLAVTVTNVNESPVITSTPAASVAENSTAVATITAVDPDAGAVVTFALSGPDAALFAIDPATGVLTFIAPPNFEAPQDAGGDNVYDVTVTASDGLGGTTTQDLAVTVTNVNEAPTITSAPAASVAENSTAVATITAVDPDAGAVISFALSGPDAALFAIDPATGVLTFIAPPNFEAPQDAGGDNVYDVTVTASDGLGGTTTQDLAVTVTNVNEAPTITSAPAASVAENSTAVATITAVDPDAGAVISFALSGPDAALFAIDPATGVLTFIAPPNFEAPQDAGGDNVYDVTVTASDGLGGTTTQNLAVTVTNVNEAPTITSAPAASVAENSTAVATITAVDPDAGAVISFALSGPDAALFAIDPATGVLTFIAPPNFEAPQDAGGNNVYDVTVTASDGLGGTTTQNLAVTVTNVNEAPTITSAPAASVAENTTAVATITAVDPDAGAVISFALSGPDAALFAIDPATGVLTFIAPPNFEAPQDAGGDNVYDVTVTASDGLGGTTTQDLAVTVTNVNESPVITSAPAASVAENTTAVTTVTAVDPDGDPVSFVLGGPDAALFTIDPVTGVLTFITPPDLENPTDQGGNNVYDVTVTASDGNGGSTTQALTVTVTDANDAPVITSAPAATVNENTTAVLTVTASDADNNALSFALSGADAALFAIDAATGAIRFVAAPNFEAPQDAGGDNVYDVTVTVSDGQGGTDTQDIAITVTDVNEAPVITSGAAASVAENTTAVTTVTAVDPDAGAVISFALSGPDAALFTIDPATGVLTFIAPPNFEAPQDAGGNNVYDVTVTASDGLGGTTTQDLAVTVTNVNESPVITSAPAASVAENSTAVATITAVDPDAGAVISFALSGPDAALFAIDPATGVLTFIAPPNFEAPQDAGGNNVYDVTVTASDGLGGTTTQNLAVTVTNVNESPVITSAPAASVAENSTAVATITAVDPDAGAVVSFALSGPDAALFAINAATGQLSFIAPPNFEAPGDQGGNNVYDVTVTASDGLGGTTTQNLAVTVTNVNEAPTITSSAVASIVENSTAVTTVTAVDPDAGAVISFALSGADAALFTINAAGQLSFIAAPDFEAPADQGGNNVYNVNVTASDGLGGSTTQSLAVTVTNVNEAPTITSVDLATPENVAAVTTLTAVDPEGNPVTWTIGGTDAALFTVNAATGALSFFAAPNFEAPADAGGDNVYNIVAVANDGLGGVTSKALAITVTDANDAPVITSAPAATTAENSTAVTTITAEDQDGDPVTFALSGADAALFTIDANTGVLRFIAAPNFEAPQDAGGNNVYNVTVTASDNRGGSTTQALAVTVTNVNDAPVITSGAAFAINENLTAVTTVTANDEDGNPLTFSLNGGADAARFTINAATGALAFLVAPDGDIPGDVGGNNVYDVVVRVSDGQGGFDDQAIAVTVNNIAETGARADSFATTDGVILSLGAANGVLVNDEVADGGTLSVVSAGGVAAGTPVAGSAGGTFTIGSNGSITFNPDADFVFLSQGETAVTTVTYTLTDGLGTTSTNTASVTVTGVNSAPELLLSAFADPGNPTNAGAENGLVGIEVGSGGPAGTVTETITDILLAGDPDQSDTLVFALSGEDAALFTVGVADVSLAELESLLSSLGRTLPDGFTDFTTIRPALFLDTDSLSSDGDQLFEFTVTVTDQFGASASTDYEVLIT